MARLLQGLVLVVLAAGLWPAAADDPPAKLTPDERKELLARLTELSKAANEQSDAGKIPDAEKLNREALIHARRLYPRDDFPDGHPNLAGVLNNLAGNLLPQARLAEAESLFREALEMKRRWFKGDSQELALGINNLAGVLEKQGRYTDAEALYREALEMNRRLFKNDHPYLLMGLNNVASALMNQGRLAEAEPPFREAAEMGRRMFKGDHVYHAITLNNLSSLYRDQGKLAEAEPLCRESLEMRRRLFKGDHPTVAVSLNNLAILLSLQKKLAEAEKLSRESLEMKRRLYKGDHPDIVRGLGNLAGILEDQDRFTDAAALFRESADMVRRLFKGDHREVAATLNNLGSSLSARGQLDDAEPVYREALEMSRRLHTGDHREVITGLYNLASVHHRQGKYGDADRLLRDALAMYRRLIVAQALQTTEGQALTLLGTLPYVRDAFLTNARAMKADVATVYPEVWASKASVSRIYEQRQQAARAAATDPKAAKQLAQLAAARRRRADLILAPDPRDPATRTRRQDDIKELDRQIADLDRDLRPLLPAIDRAERLAMTKPAEMQKLLPADAAIVDFLRYVRLDWDKARPGKGGEIHTLSYVAFVVTRDKIAWIDLGPAEPIEDAVDHWRAAIVSGKEVPAAVPTKVRDLVWANVREQLPAGVKTVYLSPDWVLSRLPWAALPGDKPGTILLEDFAVAVIPHGSFLLGQLWPRDAAKAEAAGVLVVGGVDYQAAIAGRPAGDVPVLSGVKAGWSELPAAAAEATGVGGVAADKKLAVTPLRGDKATTAAVLAELPKARYAHFATHGFFADPAFRSVFQVDERLFAMTRRGERVGAGAISPLVMTGVVLAGANNPRTPGRGVLTGEALVDLDLSGLELAVLSACETGLGNVAGGEGTFGLQRAFHLAGARNVVATLWKVPDQSTAALMALFYRNLWGKNLTPIEALRQAQLEIYRNPGKIPELAGGFRGSFKELPGAKDIGVKAGPDGKAPPRLWAAFTLSGPGR